jgi:hypothetical protein
MSLEILELLLEGKTCRAGDVLEIIFHFLLRENVDGCRKQQEDGREQERTPADPMRH